MAKDIIGLDMSDASIEVIVLNKRGTGFSVTSYSRYKISPDIIEAGRIIKEDRLKEALLGMFKNGQPKPINPDKVYFSIPESRAFIRNISVPKVLKSKEIPEAIQHQAEETIPEAFDNLLTAYQELSVNNNHREFTYIAAQADIVRSYLKLFKDLGIEVAGITTESIAAIAGLNDKFKKNTTLLLDLGSKVTIASIYDSRGIKASINIDIGGNAMLVAVQERFNISYADAENRLRDVGLTSAPGDGEVMLLLQGQLQPLTDEIKHFVAYWQEMANIKIEQVVLVGGLTQMRGLVDYFSANLAVPVFIGESFLVDHQDKDQVVFTKYINALGLARLASTRNELNFYNDKNKDKLGVVSDQSAFKIQEDAKSGNISDQDEVLKKPVWKKILTNVYFIIAIILVGLAGAVWFLRAPIKALLNPKVSFDFTNKAVIVGVANKSGVKDFVYAQLAPFTLTQQRDYKDLNYDQVKSNILADMSKQLIDGLNKEYTKGAFYLIPAVVSTTIDSIQPSQESFVLGQAMTIKATFQVLAINQFDIKNVLVNQLEASDKSKAANLDIKAFNYNIQSIDANSQTANLQVNMTISNK
ncbi:MAG: pilus assembly protein PilM [Patescibacteria group bacterium]|jgi:type IV pilus assembly protein PilM